MTDTTTTTTKKTTRTRKTVSSPSIEPIPITPSKSIQALSELFSDIINRFSEEKASFDGLQRQIADVQEAWVKEQQRHEAEVKERDLQEGIERRREQEAYDYEIAKKRRLDEDIFLEKKARWEKELTSQQDQIAKEREELILLRKQVEGFEVEKTKVVKEATTLLQKDLSDSFINEKKLREQEVRAEKELLALKITNLTQENTRLTGEANSLKQSLEAATRQLKEVAVKVIESHSSVQPPPSNSQQ